MRDKKGQIAPLVGLALFAIIVIGTGLTIGSVKGLLQFIVKNWFTMFLLVIGVSVAATFVINSYQKNPKWKEDIAGLAVLLGILLLVGVVPAIKGVVQTYTAKVDVKMDRRLMGYKIERFNVRSNSFKKKGLSGMGLNLESLGFWDIFQKEVTLKGEVSCNQKKVDSFEKDYKITVPFSKSDTIVIRSLPSGGNCRINGKLFYNGEKVDEASDTFVVPRG